MPPADGNSLNRPGRQQHSMLTPSALETDMARRLESRLRRSDIPKYVHLVEVIEEMVREGVLLPGYQLPAESQLCQQVPLSLGTVQKSMSVLQAHGIVSREHGRGTFVRGVSPELRDLWHFRFLADDGKTVLPVFPEVIAVDTVGADGPWAEFLERETGYIRILRNVVVNNEFSVRSEFFVSLARCAGFLSMPLAKLSRTHMRDVLRERFGLTTARVVEQVSCELLPAAVIQQLDLRPRSMGLVCHILAYDFRDMPVSFHRIFVPPDTRRLEMRERAVSR